MNSEHKTEIFDYVTAADHETEESLVITPSPGAPDSGDWHRLPAGSDYNLKGKFRRG